ncbi:MAG: hypothetical protein KDJ80_12890 [Nitratireductor sp.]|nr:hypothetical protein [Nitratireductor sp.]
MSTQASSSDTPVVIKRYASRKLYDADAKEYVTIEDIARYIREGRDVQIVDKNTGEDLTRQYLVQIIADFESQGESALPLNILTDLVRHYQEQASSMTSSIASAMTPAFLGQMFETFKAQQEKTLSELGEMGSRALDPEKLMASASEAMAEWQAKQGEFFSQAMRQWGFGGTEPERPAPEPDKGSGQGKSTSTADDRSAAAGAGKDAQIKAIEENLKNLQDKLDKLR